MHRVAVAGCGLISISKYLPILCRIKDRVSIVGICDLNRSVLGQSASTFGIPHAYVDFSEMLSQGPDIVIVCTPPSTHAGLAIEAIERGAHVLVEKPMALTLADCNKMVEAAARCHRKLGVMHNQVFNPAFETAREAVAHGHVGDFLGMRIFLMTSVHEMTADPEHWAHRLPGGMVGETGPHAVYLSLAFLERVTDVHVRLKKHLPEHNWSVGEDIRFDLIAENGFSSTTLIYGSNQTAAEVDIIGTTGMLRVDLQARIAVNHNRSQDIPGVRPRAILKSFINNLFQTTTAFFMNGLRYTFSESLDGHSIGIKRFLDYVEDKDAYPATGEEGKQVQEVMEMVTSEMRGCERSLVRDSAGHAEREGTDETSHPVV